MRGICVISVVVLLTLYLDIAKSENSNLISNGYEGVLIAIHNSVPEDYILIDKIKNMMTEASAALLEATKGRAYFRNVKILVPKSWKEGNYSASRDETFDATDIRIAHSVDDAPYTRPKAEGGCGDQMQFIHLTPNYVKSDGLPQLFGPIGKAIVHEWSHYRWGVFDEYPSGNTKPERHANSFYLNQAGQVEATRCSLEIQGTYYDSSTQQACEIDLNNRLPKYGCVFDESSSQQQQGLEVSMMYKQFINSITTFCHDDASDPINLHNKEAPNDQNKYCNYRSTWDVISNTSDFKFDNPPNPAIQDTQPQFNVIQAQAMSVVLVMDVSGSMDGSKLASLRNSAEYFLSTCVTYGTYVGLVTFSSSASVNHGLVEVNNESTRQQLIQALPVSAWGGTGIGSAILKGIEVLEQGGRGSEGGILVVLTDGQENASPYVRDVASSTLRKGVVVNSIFFGLVNVQADGDLAELSKNSGGYWFYNSDDAEANAELNNIFCSLAKPKDGDVAKSSVPIASTTLTVYSSTPISMNVSIDGSVGNRTTFSFTWTAREPTVELWPPNSSCYYSNKQFSGSDICGSIHNTSIPFKTVRFFIPGIAQVGQWQYTISTTSSYDYITVAVTSASSIEGVYPVTVEPDIVQANILGVETVIVVTKVLQNTLPVIGANVTAKVTRPIGGPLEIELRDNGAGADRTPNDGIYSRYFTAFTKQGRYSVEVQVFKDGSKTSGATVMKSGTISQGSKTFIPFDKLPDEVAGAEITGVLERVASSPGLAYTGEVTSYDIFPPNKITDLSVEQADLDDASSGVRITFTAPGDDFDSGRAEYYDIRYTTDSLSVLLSNFENQTRLNITDDDESNAVPKDALSIEDMTVPLPLVTESSSLRLAFAVRSYDEANNPSEISNVALTTFFIQPPPKPTAATTPSSSPSTYLVSYWVIVSIFVILMFFG